jgi:hypothetical protein
MKNSRDKIEKVKKIFKIYLKKFKIVSQCLIFILVFKELDFYISIN